MLEVIDCEQGSNEWHMHRSVIITASNMSKVLAKGEGKTRAAYAKQIACARHTGERPESWEGNQYTERGKEQEPEAGELYCAISGNKTTTAGFMVNHQEIGGVGYSPDFIVTGGGLAEIKTKKAELHIDVMTSGKVPSEHIAQIQTGIWVAEQDWLDFVCYSRGMPMFLKRVYRDDAFIKNATIEVIKFYREVDEYQNFLINYDTRKAWI